jgi:putative SOS response-associated peptidase YedK
VYLLVKYSSRGLVWFDKEKNLKLRVWHGKISSMSYALETDHNTLETTFGATKSFGFWQAREAVIPGMSAPIIRVNHSSPLLDPLELGLLRYGLVPPGFTSPREADRYGLHQVRAKRVGWQREVGKLFAAGNRCLVPMTRAGELVAAAGLWGKWTRVRGRREERLESFAVFAVQDARDEWQPLMLETWDWLSWLEETVDLETVALMPAPISILERAT